MRTIRLSYTMTLLAALLAPASAEDQAASIASGHNLLQEGSDAAQIEPGTPVAALAFHALDGKPIYLAECLQEGPVAFVFLSTKCPMVKQYTERLRRLHETYTSRGLTIFGVFSNQDESDERIKDYVAKTKYSFTVVRDVNGYIARRLGAKMTPQVFLIDQQSILRYRGAIDDNRTATRVKTQHLVAAVDSVLSDAVVAIPSTRALGCTIHLNTDATSGEITYTGHVARILQDNCQSCHRVGQVAPFALTNYEEASTWATEIAAYTHDRLMPPWKAAPGFGDFKNDISLGQSEIDLMARWVEAGTPLGNPRDMPPRPKFHDDWAYGEPDLILEMPQEYVVGPEGEDDYRHFVIPHEFAQDRFVEAVDVRPGNRNVVHHVIAYVDTSGKARQLDAADDGPGYTRFGDVGFEVASVIGGWAPGNLPAKTPPGSGSWLPKKCDVVLQVHYYRSGVEERDRTKIGVYFSQQPDPVPARMEVVINTKFTVPAGKKNHVVHAQKKINKPCYLYAVTPHMHLIGETMQVTAELPDRSTIPIVKIDDWDFNWQIGYRFREFQYLPAGTTIHLIATFDNSADNPNNPNSPPKDIRWGEKTTDEMCIAFLEVLRESEYDPAKGGRREDASKVATVGSGG